MALKMKHAQCTPERSAHKFLKSIGYNLGKIIGQGTYSKVCIAHSENKRMACKIINKKHAGSDFIRKFLPREMKFVSSITHPHIITVYNIMEINDIIYMFMDYCRNGDLLEYIKNNGSFKEMEARNLFAQLCSAVNYLHNLDISHRDIKCENVFLTSTNKIKLGDFGFTRSCVTDFGTQIMSDTFCGSAAYAAPEILQGISYYPKAIDIWALGCILYIMLTATMPFDDSNVKKMIKIQQNRSLTYLIQNSWNKHSPMVRNLLGEILEPNVNKRANIKDIIYSPWFIGYKGDLDGSKLDLKTSIKKINVIF